VPIIVADCEAQDVAVYPRNADDSSVAAALMRSCGADALEQLRHEGVRACLRIPFSVDGIAGEFRCDSRTPRDPHFELHAAAELFAQLFAMRLEIDRLRSS
jgi:light-regulated signal transduction histidine kinase (bacteriophytochrome)